MVDWILIVARAMGSTPVATVSIGPMSSVQHHLGWPIVTYILHCRHDAGLGAKMPIRAGRIDCMQALYLALGDGKEGPMWTNV